MDQLESRIGRHLWDLYYISSADLFAGCEKSSQHFTIRVISVIRKVFDAVQKRQFEKAVLAIGNIRLVCSKLPSEKHYLKSTLKAFSFYFPSLFYVVLQRHLESGCPVQVISEKYSEVVSSFVSTCVFKNHAYDYTEFYLTQFLIFHLAHQLLDEADKALEHNLTHQDPEWGRVRQIYRYWLDYEKWQHELQEYPTARLSPTLCSFFSTILDSSLRTTHGPPMECVGFLPVLIRLAEVLNRIDELRDALAECCCSDAYLLSQVTRTLNSLGLHHVSGFLFTRAMNLIPADSMASNDFVIDIVEQQSLDPAGHGAFEDLIALNLRMLFNFMDHGRNRDNARAWGFLKPIFSMSEQKLKHFVGVMTQALSDFILIEYPGVVQNVENALATLGGIGSVALSAAGQCPLQLKFRNDNPYENGLVAEKKNLSDVVSGQLHLVVKIRRKKSKPNLDCEVQCLGMVSTMFSFKSMCDFHYLPVRKIHGENVYEDLVSKLIPTSFTSALSWWDKSGEESQELLETPHFLPPFVFSRYNTPSTKLLCNDIDRMPGNIRPGVGHGKNLRMERKAFTITVNGDMEFPSEASEAAIKDVDLRIKNESAHQALGKLFDERPMWTRVALLNETKLEDSMLKVMLAKFAFYIMSGPWGRLWCKFGYDPRKDQSAKQYQTVMVSFRQHQSIPERQRLKVSICDRGNAPSTSANMDHLEYTYKPGKLPPVRQMWYCVCDVHLPAAQKVLRKDFFAILKQVHSTHGWLPPEVINSIRSAIKEDVKKLSELMDVSEDYEAEATTADISGFIANDDSDSECGNPLDYLWIPAESSRNPVDCHWILSNPVVSTGFDNFGGNPVVISGNPVALCGEPLD
uniref:Uncharacterized protein n=1 Tax=Ditylenchus dipsaci TaxID=166011 RepID=A0A915CUZ2_9BILA